MIRVALKGLAGRKLRSALTALAIVLGVAMVSGTFVLTDTIDRGFDSAYTQSYEGSDVVISQRTEFGQQQAGPGGLPAAVLDEVRGLAQVDAATGGITDTARLIDRRGETLGTGGVSPMAFGVDGEEAGDLNPLELADGAWPSGAGEIAIDRAVAREEGYAVGDTIRAAARGPAREYRVSGIVTLGELESLGGATIAVFDVATAQELFAKAGRLDVVRVTGAGDVAAAELQRTIAAQLPPAAQVRTSAAQAEKESQDTSEGLAFLRYFLLAFGVIALLVGSFVIANTLSITIAQRTRELATLRTLGGSRRQVLTLVVLEALVVGALASVAGLFAGLGLAKGLGALMAGVGIDLPDNGAVLAGRTVVVSLLVGIVITLVASLRPAVRATRVPPIAAVREGATLAPGRVGRAFGALTARGVRAAVAVLGWPSTRLGGPAGRLARHNATRNPGRTASTAAALTIGLALVTVVAILANGLRSNFVDSVDELFTADYALIAEAGFPSLPPEIERAVERAPGVAAVAGVSSGKAQLDGQDLMISAVGPRIAETIRIEWDEGSNAVPAQLGRDGVFVTRSWADERGLDVGSPLTLATPTGKRLELTVRGIWKAPEGGSPFGDVSISQAAFASAFPNPRNDYTFVEMEGGVGATNTAALERTVDAFPAADLQTRDQFKDAQVDQLARTLNILYVLLGLSVLVSLFGIVNTLVLTVFERTRELGMLRAIGMTRGQVRRMIRHESIVTALLGGAFGVLVGVGLAALVASAFGDSGFAFALPWGSLLVFLLAAVVVGIVAAVLPARRASRLDVLRALQHE